MLASDQGTMTSLNGIHVWTTPHTCHLSQISWQLQILFYRKSFDDWAPVNSSSEPHQVIESAALVSLQHHQRRGLYQPPKPAQNLKSRSIYKKLVISVVISMYIYYAYGNYRCGAEICSVRKWSSLPWCKSAEGNGHLFLEKEWIRHFVAHSSGKIWLI